MNTVRVFDCRNFRHDLALEDIVYLYAENKYVSVVTESEIYLSDVSVQRLMQQHEGKFVLVRRGVALLSRRANHIRRYSRNGKRRYKVIVDGCEDGLEVSRRQFHCVKAAIERNSKGG